jgi:hypothetical protein
VKFQLGERTRKVISLHDWQATVPPSPQIAPSTGERAFNTQTGGAFHILVIKCTYHSQGRVWGRQDGEAMVSGYRGQFERDKSFQCSVTQ